MENRVGIDIVSIKRIEKLYQNYGIRLLKRILSEEEYKYFQNRTKKLEFLAGRFAAKEAITKVLDKPCPLSSLTIDYSYGNRPFLRGHPDIFISISHDGDFAIAVAVKVRL